MTHWRLRWCQSSVHPWHPLQSFTSIQTLHTQKKKHTHTPLVQPALGVSSQAWMNWGSGPPAVTKPGEQCFVRTWIQYGRVANAVQHLAGNPVVRSGLLIRRPLPTAGGARQRSNYTQQVVHAASVKVPTQEQPWLASLCLASLKKGKEKAIKLHEQGAGKQEAEEEEEDKAITRSKSYAQQVSKYRRKSKNLSKFKKKESKKKKKKPSLPWCFSLAGRSFDQSCAGRKPAARGHEPVGSWQCWTAGKVKVWS